MAISNSLQILSDTEVAELFQLPKIQTKDKALLFELTAEDQTYLSKQTVIANKINYILQIGYFRAARKFYNFTFDEVADDVKYIISHHFPEAKIPVGSASKDKHYAAQKLIMAHLQYKRCNPNFLVELERQSKRLAKRDITPRFIFDELLHYCEQHKIIRPEYSTLQGIVSRATLREENRLIVKLGNLLDAQSRLTLDDLLAKDDAITKLTLLKQDPKGLATKEMEGELSKQQNVANLFKQSKHIMPTLGISRQNLQYYSDLCVLYDVYQLRGFSKKKARLHMACLVWQRFIKLNDHLSTFFIHKAGSYEHDGKNYADDCILAAKLGDAKDRKLASKMLKIVHDSSVAPPDIRPKCYRVISADKFDQFTKDLEAPNLDRTSYIWKYYGKENGSIKRNLRQIFLELDFSDDSNPQLKSAIKYSKAYFRSKNKTSDPLAEEVPLAFIPARLHKYIAYKKAVRTSTKSKRTKQVKYVDIKRYEIALYQAVAHALSAGNIFIRDSVNYRSLEDELIPLHIWQKDKDKILAELLGCIDTSPITEILNNLESELNNLYRSVNKRIKLGENDTLNIDDDGISWRPKRKKADDKADNPYYQKFPTISVSTVIDFAANNTGCYSKFHHLLNKGSKSKPKPEHIKAYLVSLGEGIGHKKVAESSDVSLTNLTDLEGRFVRVNSLIDVGDLVISEIAKLPIFKYYNLSDYGIHASLDGQKLETRYKTILSRYSTKYFGYGKGVVSYSLIANHLPVSSKIIGANEHESHHVLDIVYNNSSDLRIQSVSGDMHSVNRVNFALMHLFGYDFMPRLTQLNTRADNNLVGFRTFKGFKNDLIKPVKMVNKKLIMDEWDNVKRILASLARKDTSQSTIIKKLSSYAKKNSTLKALIEFDRIIMSIYMLKYIDDVNLRHAVHRALNRGEAFHQLRSALLQVSGKKLLGKSEDSLEVSNQCNRLLACCIIYYNASLLSELLLMAEAKGDRKLIAKIKRLSPVAWQHISLLGNFVFAENMQAFDIKEVIKEVLAKNKNKESD